VSQRSEKYAHWIGLYLSFHLNWVLGPFVHGRLQNLQTSEVTFASVITPVTDLLAYLTHTHQSVLCARGVYCTFIYKHISASDEALLLSFRNYPTK